MPGVEADGDAGEEHEDAGHKEDEDEEDGATLHRDPVLDEESQDVGEGGQARGRASTG